MTMLLLKGQQLRKHFCMRKGSSSWSTPPYSPDLAPCDFSVFLFVKSKLPGVRFDTPDPTVEVFLEHIEAIPQSEWVNMFQKWFQRMQKCIDNAGEYFEKI